MSFDSFEKKVEKLKINNPELIESYECTRSDSIDDYLYDIYNLYEKLLKIQPNADLTSLIQVALRQAINKDISLLDAVNNCVTKAIAPGSEKTTLQQYFDEISRVYDKHNNDYNIEYCENNRDKLIEMNLKTVISIAKGYQGLGLSLEELISAGNLGLVTAFDKYNPNKAKLKDDMIESLNYLDEDASVNQIIQSIQQFMTYGDIKKKFEKTFGVPDPHNKDNIVKWKEFTKADVIKWIKKNIQNATFNSVAFMWIRAYILIEIDNNSRLVKKPKTEIYNDKLKYGAYKKEVTLDIDAPIGDDSDACYGDILRGDDDPTEIEISEAYDEFKNGLNKLLEGVKPRDRSVFLKKFGIGLPRPMLPKEIADQENLSIARISQIFQSVIEQMQKNQVKYNINPDILFEAAHKLN